MEADKKITEAELQILLSKYLSRYFKVKNEVWSINREKRIDIAMVHRSDIERKYPIGIEIKTFDKKTGSDAGKWLKQAQGYSQLYFEGFDRMMIIVAPQFSENVFIEGVLMHKHIFEGDPSPDHNVTTFLGQFNIGEFQRYNRNGKRLSRIAYNGKIIWDEKDNILRDHNYTTVCKR